MATLAQTSLATGCSTTPLASVEALTWSFSVHVHTPAWLAQRREIRSFFISELDRDKVTLGDWT